MDPQRFASPNGGPHQRVDVITALKAMTIWAAYQKFDEKSKGSLEVGELADLVILSAAVMAAMRLGAF